MDKSEIRNLSSLICEEIDGIDHDLCRLGQLKELLAKASSVIDDDLDIARENVGRFAAEAEERAKVLRMRRHDLHGIACALGVCHICLGRCETKQWYVSGQYELRKCSARCWEKEKKKAAL